MAFSLNKLKNILNSNRDGQLAGSGSLDPEIGFKLSLHPVNKCLYVTVLGARHLPSLFGLSRAHGYLVKAKVFPGDQKYETTLQESSWPVWNEDFKFYLKQKDKDPKKSTKEVDLQNLVAGHFVSLTIYALLEPPKESDKRKNSKTLDSKKTSKVGEQEPAKTKNGFLEKTFSSFKSTKAEAIAQKSILEKRRTVGAATWNFDSKLFQNDLRNGLIGTPDIWRPISAITSGLSSVADSRRENKKGQLEVSVLYNSSEDGLNDVVQLTVNRFRCSVQTMQEQELFKAPLYLKATILEANKAECYWKSDRFAPTISARWDPKSATVKLSVFKASLSRVSIYISLGCKTKMAKKEILGKATIDEKSPYADTWKECLRMPAPLYLKATILEANKAECYWKSDRFAPTISARWDPKSATVKLSVFKASLSRVSIYISLGCKTKMAKKEILGKATIDEKSPYADTWKECLRMPGIIKTFWINFE